jgi:hypothetical protein
VSYTAPNRLLMPMRHSIDTFTDSWLPTQAAAGTSAWPSANLAIYVPVGVLSRVVVRKLWYEGTSTSTGNADMALYDASWAVAVAATNAAKINGVHVFDVTDTTIGPGLYYLALSNDTNTDTFVRWAPAAPMCCAEGIYTEASAYPLPSTATPAANQTLAFIPAMGMLLEATVA